MVRVSLGGDQGSVYPDDFCHERRGGHWWRQLCSDRVVDVERSFDTRSLYAFIERREESLYPITSVCCPSSPTNRESYVPPNRRYPREL
jgi:hypothetical protein